MTAPLSFGLLLLLGSAALGCFLNSCPYRRYGRNIGCSTCGQNGSGICKDSNHCCTATDCFPDPECSTNKQCPPKYCLINEAPGFCLAKHFCCSSTICQRSMQCS